MRFFIELLLIFATFNCLYAIDANTKDIIELDKINDLNSFSPVQSIQSILLDDTSIEENEEEIDEYINDDEDGYLYDHYYY